MKNSARFCQQGSPNPQGGNQQGGMSGYKLTDIDYQFYGDVALVPYVAETTYGRGAAVNGKLRSLDIYAKVNGEWNQVGSNIYPHPDMVQAQMQYARPLSPPEKESLLAAREAVWRAFFANDQARLNKLVPEEALFIGDSGQEPINKRASIFESARKFAETGAKLVRPEFPRTETQYYGSTAILYTTYLYEMENARGERRTQTGRGTEIFVRRDSDWVNAGWQIQSDK